MIETLSEVKEIIQNNLDYTLFSWSKQAGLNPIAVQHAKGVYFYDYDGKRYIDEPVEIQIDWLCPFKDRLGDVRCAVGKQADVIMLRTDRFNVTPLNDPVMAVVAGMDTSNVDSVFIAGRAMKRSGNLLHVDWTAAMKIVGESRDYVVEKSGFKLPKI